MLEQYLDAIVYAGVSTDTRSIQRGQWFCGLTGPTYDGNLFWEQAVNAGAAGLILGRSQADLSRCDVPICVVPDTLAAYHSIAQHRLMTVLSGATVVGITGSNGKTTTKNIIAAVLSANGKTHKTQSNENNEIGLPKTILSAPADSRYLVLEMGMRQSGEIRQLTRLAQPHYTVITHIGTSHIGRLGSVGAIARAKCEILESNRRKKSFCADSPHIPPHQGQTLVMPPQSVTLTAEGTRFVYDGRDYALPVVSLAAAYAACFAVEVAAELGMSRSQIYDALAGINIDDDGRSRLHWRSYGCLCDDTYNGNPDSVLMSVQNLSYIPELDRRILVLGELAELGEHADGLLRDLCAQLPHYVSAVYLLDGPGQNYIQALLSERSLPAHIYQSIDSLYATLTADLAATPTKKTGITLKGSRVARLDRLVSMMLG